MSNITLQERDNVPSFPHNAYAITPSDVTEYATPIAVEVIVSGDVEVEAFGNATEITITAAPVGYRVPFLVRRVLAGTTATVIGMN